MGPVIAKLHAKFWDPTLKNKPDLTTCFPLINWDQVYLSLLGTSSPVVGGRQVQTLPDYPPIYSLWNGHARPDGCRRFPITPHLQQQQKST